MCTRFRGGGFRTVGFNRFGSFPNSKEDRKGVTTVEGMENAALFERLDLSQVFWFWSFG